jgi:hypothetical protein
MPTADLHDLPSALRGLFRTLRVYRKELPFAGYSVVKERRARVCVARPNFGGEYRARTGDLLVANQALSQLS